MPVADHPVHEKVRFKEVPLSTCHSSLPDKTRDSYYVINVIHDVVPFHATTQIKWYSDNVCKQPVGTHLPECRGCETPEKRDAR
jgi:hypothetical protein